MQCTACGAVATVGLRYCNRCGASLITTNSLSEAEPPARHGRFTGAAWAMALAVMAITLGGFGILSGLIISILAILTEGQSARPVAPRELIPIVVPIIIFGTAAIVLVDFMLVRLFSRLMNLPPEPKPSEKNKPAIANEFRPSPIAQQQQLQAPVQSVPSVTEHTTRNFDPVYSREQGGKE